MKQKYEDIKTQHNHSITMNMQKKEEIEIAKQFFEEHERLTEENLNTVIERTKVFLRKVWHFQLNFFIWDWFFLNQKLEAAIDSPTKERYSHLLRSPLELREPKHPTKTTGPAQVSKHTPHSEPALPDKVCKTGIPVSGALREDLNFLLHLS